MRSFAIRKVLSLRIAAVAAVVLAGTAVATQPLSAQDLAQDRLAPEVTVKNITLHPNPKFISCLSVPGHDAPTATAHVTRGALNDTLTIVGKNFKPGLAFDMFTVQRSSLRPNGTADPAFTNFGMAWYQSDIETDDEGSFAATIKTILLDQIFGFDPDQSNPAPINTFHVGFWFNNPNDANVDGCTFDVAHPTPFNGEHNAGPVAFITVPNPQTKLGPLCTNPNTNTVPASCNP